MRTKKTHLENLKREAVAQAAAQLILFAMKTSEPHRDIVATSITASDQSEGRPVVEGTNEPYTDWVKTSLELQTNRGVVTGNVVYETVSDVSILMLLDARIGHDRVMWNGYATYDLAPAMVHGIALSEGMAHTYKQIEMPAFTWSGPTHTS